MRLKMESNSSKKAYFCSPKQRNMKIIYTFIALQLFANAFAQPAGSLDESFNGTGYLAYDISNQSNEARAVKLQSDGKILVAGWELDAAFGKDFFCMRLNTDGSLDATFASNGVFSLDLQSGSVDEVNDLLVQTDGKIVLGGTSDDGANKSGALVRLNSDGTADATFGTNGIAILDFGPSNENLLNTIGFHAASGNIILGGAMVNSTSNAQPVIARVTSSGIFDSSFDTDGIRTLDVAPNDQNRYMVVNDLVVESNGKITCVGSRVNHATSISAEYWYGRVLSDGNMDTGFSTDGTNDYSEAGGQQSLNSMVLDVNGNILSIGTRQTSTDYIKFLAINNNGTISNPTNTLFFSSFSNNLSSALTYDQNGQLVFVGKGSNSINTTSSGLVGRLSPSGSFDTNFGSSGKVDFAFENGGIVNDQNGFNDVTVQSDNKIVAVGFTDHSILVCRFLGNDEVDVENFNQVSPTNGAVDLSYPQVTMSWTEAFNAPGYELQLDVVATFDSNPMSFIINAPNTSVTANGLTANTTYYWRVRAFDGSSYGTYRPTWSFTTSENLINLSAPQNNSSGLDFDQVTLSWLGNGLSTSFEVTMDTQSDFNGNPITFTPTGTTQNFTSLVADQTYFWRVRGKDANNEFGPYSDTWTFNTKTLEDFSLVNPVNFATDLNPYATTMDWTQLQGVQFYQVEYAVDANFTSSVQLETVSTTSLTVNDLQPNTTYFWHVRATQDGTLFGDYTPTRQFTTQSDLSVDNVLMEIIQIAPNPTTGALEVRTSEGFIGEVYHLTDLNGRLVASGTLTNSFQVDFSNYAEGVYMFTVPGKPGQIRIVKI